MLDPITGTAIAGLAIVSEKVAEKAVEVLLDKTWHDRDKLVALFQKHVYGELQLLELSEKHTPARKTIRQEVEKLSEFLRSNEEALREVAALLKQPLEPNFGEFNQYRELSEFLKLLEEKRAQEPDDLERLRISAKINTAQEQLQQLESTIVSFADTITKIKDPSLRQIEARELFFAGKLDEARILLEDAREEMQDIKTRGLAAKGKKESELADINQKLEVNANDYLLLAQATAVKFNNPDRIADASQYFEDSIECAASFHNLYSYALFLWLHSEFRRASNLWLSALEIARKDNNKIEEENCLSNLGLVHRSLGEYPKAIDFLEKGLKISKEIGDHLGEAITIGNLGDVYIAKGQYKEAIDFHTRALKILKETSHRRGEAASLNSLGGVYYSLSKYEQAIYFYEQSLKIEQEIGHRRGEGGTLGNLGLIYQSLGDYKKAIKYHEKALKIAQEMGDRYNIGNQLGNLGIANDSLGDYQKAIGYHLEALKIVQEIGDKYGEGIIFGNLGSAYSALNEYQKAIGYYTDGLRIAEEIGDSFGIGFCFKNIGVIYMKSGEFENACEYWRRALIIFETIGVPEAAEIRGWLKKAESVELEWKDKTKI